MYSALRIANYIHTTNTRRKKQTVLHTPPIVIGVGGRQATTSNTS